MTFITHTQVTAAAADAHATNRTELMVTDAARAAQTSPTNIWQILLLSLAVLSASLLGALSSPSPASAAEVFEALQVSEDSVSSSGGVLGGAPAKSTKSERVEDGGALEGAVASQKRAGDEEESPKPAEGVVLLSAETDTVPLLSAVERVKREKEQRVEALRAEADKVARATAEKVAKQRAEAAAAAKAAEEAAAAKAAEEAAAREAAIAEARAAAPMPKIASVEGVELHQMSKKAVGVGFHEAGWSAIALSPNLLDAEAASAPEQVQPHTFVLPTRARGTSPTSAIDVAMPEGEKVLSPVTGTVASVAPYSLYGRYPDSRVMIVPDSNPNLRVVMMHVRGIHTGAGTRVEQGKTVIADSATQFPFASQIDRFLPTGPHPHVHLEVRRG